MRISYVVSLVFFYSFCRCKQDRSWRLSVRCNNDDNIICMLYLLRFTCAFFFFSCFSRYAASDFSSEISHCSTHCCSHSVHVGMDRRFPLCYRYAMHSPYFCSEFQRFHHVCVWVRRQTLKYRFHKGAHRMHNGIMCTKFVQTLSDCRAEIRATRSFDLPFEFIIY